MIIKCEICGDVLAGDEVEHLYKGKSYCEDCFKSTKKVGEMKQEKIDT